MSSSSSPLTGGEVLMTMAERSSGELLAQDMTQTVYFSSGNPRIEETRGAMHLFFHGATSSSSSSSASAPDLPIGRKSLVCVLGVPNHMTYADFCLFCGTFIQHIMEMRTVRNDGMENRYSILIKFDNQDNADKFFVYFNGRQFNSLEEEVCQVRFTIDVQFTGYSASLDNKQVPHSQIEQPSCPVCLEKFDQDSGGILTTICNHSFHCSCISNWTDSSCPVCRYCQQLSETSVCSVCQTSENLWMCLMCGFVGCGRYKGGHAVRHWKDTEHCYSLELETQRVWDYAGDNYVHRLIQSKTDGKLVELNSHCVQDSEHLGNCEYGESGISEVLLNSKVEAIVNEYNELLHAQLENQKHYFEAMLKKVKDETEMKVAAASGKAISQRLHKMQAKLDRCVEEKSFLDALNDNLLRNQDIWKAKISEEEDREKEILALKHKRCQELEEQMKVLMGKLEATTSVEQTSGANKIKDGTHSQLSIGSSSSKNRGGR